MSDYHKHLGSYYKYLQSILVKAQGAIDPDGKVVDVGGEVVTIREICNAQAQRIKELEARLAYWEEGQDLSGIPVYTDGAGGGG